MLCQPRLRLNGADVRQRPVSASRLLNLPATYFDAPFTDFQYKLRASGHYPSQPKAPDDEFGIAPHTDTNFLTLLAPNDVPGLAFRTQAGDWIDVPTFLCVLSSMAVSCCCAGPTIVSSQRRTARSIAPASSASRWRFSATPRSIAADRCRTTCVGPGRPPRYETTYYTDYMIRYQARTYNVFGDQAKGAAE